MTRNPEHDILPIFTQRWSQRALSPDVSKEELMQLFEAAKWAPSSYNVQPWRFIYATRDSKNWDAFYDLLVEFNQLWAKNAAALVIIASKTTNDDGEPNKVHSFDTGSAWMSLALQATSMDIVAHGMAGFDYDKAKQLTNLPDDYQIEAMIAIGRHGDLDVIPERMQKGETLSDRKPLAETVFENEFK